VKYFFRELGHIRTQEDFMLHHKLVFLVFFVEPSGLPVQVHRVLHLSPNGDGRLFHSELITMRYTREACQTYHEVGVRAIYRDQQPDHQLVVKENREFKYDLS
jgi:hypothetical protein